MGCSKRQGGVFYRGRGAKSVHPEINFEKKLPGSGGKTNHRSWVVSRYLGQKKAGELRECVQNFTAGMSGKMGGGAGIEFRPTYKG